MYKIVKSSSMTIWNIIEKIIKIDSLEIEYYTISCISKLYIKTLYINY